MEVSEIRSHFGWGQGRGCASPVHMTQTRNGTHKLMLYVGGKQHYFGVFKTKEDAEKAKNLLSKAVRPDMDVRDLDIPKLRKWLAKKGVSRSTDRNKTPLRELPFVGVYPTISYKTGKTTFKVLMVTERDANGRVKYQYVKVFKTRKEAEAAAEAIGLLLQKKKLAA